MKNDIASSIKDIPNTSELTDSVAITCLSDYLRLDFLYYNIFNYEQKQIITSLLLQNHRSFQLIPGLKMFHHIIGKKVLALSDNLIERLIMIYSMLLGCSVECLENDNHILSIIANHLINLNSSDPQALYDLDYLLTDIFANGCKYEFTCIIQGAGLNVDDALVEFDKIPVGLTFD